MQGEFARALIANTAMPITLEAALNWTAAGLLSEDSIVGGSVPIQIPEYWHGKTARRVPDETPRRAEFRPSPHKDTSKKVAAVLNQTVKERRRLFDEKMG